MHKNIALLPGDGVGSEIVSEAKKVLDAVAKKFTHTFTYTEAVVGGAAIDKTGDPYPAETHSLCMNSDAVLFGAIGDPKYDNNPNAPVRPEQGLLTMRQSLGLYANVRPIFTTDALLSLSPLKEEIARGVDILVIRELTGGIYFGKKGRSHDGLSAFDTSVYTREEIERIIQVAFEFAAKRKKHVTVVDKANVLATSQLWREVAKEKAGKQIDIEVDFMFVDNASMQLIKRPREFDVLLTENMFGDILTDEASVISGSIGLLPSASIGRHTSVYEPIHGSYPKATGQNIANPVGTILSAALMLEHSFEMFEEALAVRTAVTSALENKIGTKDIFPDNPSRTSDVGDTIAKNI